AIGTAQSGFPTPVSSNLDTTGTGIVSRPDIVAGQECGLPVDHRSWKKWFNTSAFTHAPFGRFGTSPRTDSFRLTGGFHSDFSATQVLRFRESKVLQFRVELSNLVKHYNPDPQTVDTNLTSATFGAVGGGVQGITTRVIQFGAKLFL